MTLDQSAPASVVSARGWEGRLRLEYAHRDGRSVLARREHRGPLAVQRAFYPEPGGTCHSYVLHPPGGVVGGDRLSLEVELGAGSEVLLTTPAATKFYRSAGVRAEQRQLLRCAAGARLEWLPQETIVFAGAHLSTVTRVELAAGAAFVGWEMVCLGRPASGERFSRGEVVQRLEVYRDDRPLVLERARYCGAGLELDASWGLGGCSVVGTLLCVAADDRPLDPERLAELRACLSESAGVQATATQLAGAVACRYLGDRAEPGMRAFRSAWALLRPLCLGKAAVAPRIWAT